MQYIRRKKFVYGDCDMKILVFSDSHGYLQNMVKAVNKNKDVQMIIHLGDIVGDALELQKKFPQYPLHYVRGNNDFGMEHPKEKILEIEGLKILLTHGHAYGVKNDYQRIISMGNSLKVNAVFFGHTHQREEFLSNRMLVLNPGSIGIPKYPDPKTYCVVVFDSGKIYPFFESIH